MDAKATAAIVGAAICINCAGMPPAEAPARALEPAISAAFAALAEVESAAQSVKPVVDALASATESYQSGDAAACRGKLVEALDALQRIAESMPDASPAILNALARARLALSR